MKRAEFEQRVLSLWVSTRVPLTPVNLQLATGLPRAKLLGLLEQLVDDQILEVDSDDAGELLWTVPGAERAADGLSRIADVQRLEQLRAEVQGESGQRAPGQDSQARGGRAQAPTRAALVRERAAGAITPKGERKSLVASGLLSFFLGPVGWLYAGPIGEAVPALAVYLLAVAIVPGILLKPLLAVLAPISAIIGALYAFAHNARGERSSLRELRRGASAARHLLAPPADE